MSRRRSGARLLVVAVVAAAMTTGGGSRVLCLHGDGTAEIETVKDPCCQAAAARSDQRPGVAAAEEGRCPGCVDRTLSADGRAEPHRAHPAPTWYAVAISAAAPGGGSGRSIGRIARDGNLAAFARGAPQPLALRI